MIVIIAVIIITNTNDFRNLQCGLKLWQKQKGTKKSVMEMKQTIL